MYATLVDVGVRSMRRNAIEIENLLMENNEATSVEPNTSGGGLVGRSPIW